MLSRVENRLGFFVEKTKIKACHPERPSPVARAFLWQKTKIKACHPEPRQPPALGTAARRLMVGREDPLDYNQWRPKRSREKVFLGALPATD